jgi:hypothetical protein
MNAANLAVALELAEAGVSIFPARVSWDGQSGKWQKQPLVKRWQKAATTDRVQLKAWFERHSGAVPGIELGRAKLIVIDADRHGGPDGVAAMNALATANGGLPHSPVTNTAGGGTHLIFRQPEGEKFGNARGALPAGIDVRGAGGWIVAPGSVRPDGAMWAAAEGTPLLAEAFQAGTIPVIPEWVTALIQGKGSQSRSNDTGEHTSSSPPEWSEAEEARIKSALDCIPADDRDVWSRIGMALHWTGWGDRARRIWEKWSNKSTKYDADEQDKAWDSFGKREGKDPVTLGTLFYLAKKHGWEDAPIKEINELNERHFVIRNIGGKCLIGEMVPNRMGSGQMLSLQRVNDFKTWYSNRKIAKRNKGKKDDKQNEKVKSLGTIWIEHPKRRQYEGVDLIPNAPMILPNGHLNLWRGFGINPTQGQWPLMFQHICLILANSDRKSAEYILRWTAWSVQNPGELAEVALVLRGGKGSGKGIFGNALAKCFGEHALHIYHQNHLTGNFNAHLRSCLFLFADEAFWAGDKKGESVLKGLVTEPSLMIEQKGIDAIQWPNRLHIMMAANADWVVPASHDERRFAVFDVSDQYAKGQVSEGVRMAYFDALHNELKSGGLQAMLHDLLQYDLGSWHPRQVYETEGLRRQKEQSMSFIEQWFDELLQDGKLPGWRWRGSDEKPDFATTQSLIEDAHARIPRLKNYLSEKAMGDFLRRRGCQSNRTNKVRGWQFLPLGQMRAEWDKRYGRRVWENPDQQDWP